LYGVATHRQKPMGFCHPVSAVYNSRYSSFRYGVATPFLRIRPYSGVATPVVFFISIWGGYPIIKNTTVFWGGYPSRILHFDMGWLRLIGSSKSQVSFAKEPYERDDIQQKRHMNLRSLLMWHGVATISRLLKIIRLFCRRSSLLQGSFAQETCTFKEPTNRVSL